MTDKNPTTNEELVGRIDGLTTIVENLAERVDGLTMVVENLAQATHAGFSAMESQFGEIKAQLNEHRIRMGGFESRMDRFETRMDRLEIHMDKQFEERTFTPEEKEDLMENVRLMNQRLENDALGKEDITLTRNEYDHAALAQVFPNRFELIPEAALD